jgi:pyruvate dehydrogenase E2 component (dihydrolipoamide acetyltransferase)
MAKTIELTVPDLGGFADVPIIEVLVAEGDAIVKDSPLVTLESDKATMEVPASSAGIIRGVRVRIGDRVSPGSVLANVEVADDVATPVAAPAAKPPTATPPATSASPALSAAPHELVVPDLGGFENVPVISVFVAPGDVIAKDAPLVELESDKATMEVPASSAGVVHEVRVRVGDHVSPGSVIVTLAASASATAAPPADSPAVPTPARNERAATPPVDAPPALAAAVAPAAPSHNGSSNGVADPSSHASPAIRRFARELGVPIRRVSGSGPNGRITRDDVQQFVKRALSAPSAAPTGGGLQVLPWPKIDFEKFGPIERRPLSRIAKISGQNLARNWVMIPHVTQHEDADVTDLESFRKAINGEQKDVKVTMLALLMKALVATLRQFPNFNSSLDGDELVLKRYYHLGFAADTPGGLVVPVIRDVDQKGILEIAIETATLAKKARDGKLGPGEMSGSTFTVSSLGGIGGTAFTPIINAPEVAILGVSRTLTKPVWDGASFKPRLILPLSLSYDHRVIDGAAAARFCVYLAGVLADMRKTLL